jgi:serine/threonine-protein kinase HipA
MVFNAAVTNNDDHPRNHALLPHPDGWRLSPVYDVVPVPVVSLERRDLALTVGSYGRAASLYNLVSQSNRFGLSEVEARKEIRHVASVVRKWRDRFAASGVSRKDIEYIAPAMLSPSFLSEEPPQAAVKSVFNYLI